TPMSAPARDALPPSASTSSGNATAKFEYEIPAPTAEATRARRAVVMGTIERSGRRDPAAHRHRRDNTDCDPDSVLERSIRRLAVQDDPRLPGLRPESGSRLDFGSPGWKKE